MSTESNRVKTSPTGSILFMAAEKAVKQSKSSDKEVFTIKLAFDCKKDAEFLTWVSSINDTKVVTAQTYRGKSQTIKDVLATGKAVVSANSAYKPFIYDANGNRVEEAPYFNSTSTGTAQMIVEPYVGEKGGTINLVGILIHSIDTPQGETKDRSARVAELDALVKANLSK